MGALEMMTNCDDNSWCHMLRQGATAVMEAWTRKEKPNLSWSHPWASAPATAIAQGLVGIKALSPGHKQFIVRPQLGSLEWAQLQLPVMSGFITVRLDKTSSKFQMKLTAPGSTEATICLPSLGNTALTLQVDGVSRTGFKDGDYICMAGVGSGDHTI